MEPGLFEPPAEGSYLKLAELQNEESAPTSKLKFPLTLPNDEESVSLNLMGERRESVDSFWEASIKRDEAYLSKLPAPVSTLNNSIVTEQTIFSWASILQLTCTSSCCLIIGILASFVLGLILPAYAYLLGSFFKVSIHKNFEYVQ